MSIIVAIVIAVSGLLSAERAAEDGRIIDADKEIITDESGAG